MASCSEPRRRDTGTGAIHARAGVRCRDPAAVHLGPLHVAGIATAGRSSGERGGFGLGGFLNLSGTTLGAISGSHIAGLSGLLYYRMGELPRGFGRGWYAGASIEAGNAWTGKLDLTDVRKAASIFLGLDTVIGPLYLVAGHTFGGQSRCTFSSAVRPTGSSATSETTRSNNESPSQKATRLHVKKIGGGGRNRTGVHGFAGRCMTTLPPRHDCIAKREGTRETGCPFPREIWSGKESRTRDLNLGKVALYQLSYSRV